MHNLITARPTAATRTKTPGGARGAPSTEGHADQMSLLSGRAMRDLSVVPPSGTSPTACAWCEKNPGKTCPACASRRKRVVALASAQLDLAELRQRLELSLEQALVLTDAERAVLEAIAGEMKISVERVERLLEQALDAQAIADLAADGKHVPTAPLRRLIAQAELHDSSISISEIARRAGYRCPTDLGRKLGRYATARTVKNGVEYGGDHKTTIARVHAERVIRALGYAPTELDVLLRRYGAGR